MSAETIPAETLVRIRATALTIALSGHGSDDEAITRCLTELIAADRSTRPSEPVSAPAVGGDGLAPRKPTKDMIRAGMAQIGGGSTFDRQDRCDIAKAVYEAMCAAAPVPPTPTGGDREVEAVASDRTNRPASDSMPAEGDAETRAWSYRYVNDAGASDWVIVARLEGNFVAKEGRYEFDALVPATLLAAERAAREKAERERYEARADHEWMAQDRNGWMTAANTARAETAQALDALRVAGEALRKISRLTWDRNTLIVAQGIADETLAALAAQTKAKVGTALPVQDGGAEL